MKNISETTTTSGFTYPVEIQQFESVEEATDKLGATGILNVLNAAQRQNAMQGPKASVLKAVQEARKAGDLPDEATLGKDTPKAVREAVEAAQKATAGYVLGGGTGTRSGGPSQKRQLEIMTTLRTGQNPETGEALSADEIGALYAELGIPQPGA
jgi:hypothetical protein